MSYLITIQYPYQYLEITIAENTTPIASKIVPKIQAVALLIPAIQEMLESLNITLADISCIGINTGPGPFNTLRSIIATANGIAFALHIPLVGCNGLELILQENDQDNQVAIMDAFGTDVYYALQSNNQQGYTSIANLITMLNKQDSGTPITFIGNGLLKHKEYILQNFAGTAIFNPELLFASMQSLINETHKNYTNGKIEQEIFPLYFASPVVKS